MPVKITKTDHKYRVTHGGKTSAKGTTKALARRQVNLLKGIKYGRRKAKR